MKKEEAEKLGIRIKPVKHSMKRRASWHDYRRRGVYLVTICIKSMDADGGYYAGTLLSRIEGDSRLLPPGTYGRDVGGRLGSACCARCYSTLTSNKGGSADGSDDGSASGNDGIAPYPHTVLTDLGRLLEAKIGQIGCYRQFCDVEVRRWVIMPTHIHMIVAVKRDLPLDEKRHRQYTLSDMVRGFKQGCTSLFKQWLAGTDVDTLLALVEEQTLILQGKKVVSERIYTSAPGSQSEVTLWEEGYNDRALIDEEAEQKAAVYIAMNPWRWKVMDDHPQMLSHLLRITIGRDVYSAYGCMFLLRSLERVQIFCHRYARKGELMVEEWAFASRADVAARLEREAIDNRKRMGRWDRGWLYSKDPQCVCPIPYHKTETFRQRKVRVIEQGLMGAVLVSPAVSDGEQEIFYDALEQGCRCIKLQASPLPRKAHPQDRDIILCAQGQLLVLGPWEIEGDVYRTADGREISKESFYARFHNLNEMARKLCEEPIGEMAWREYE